MNQVGIPFSGLENGIRDCSKQGHWDLLTLFTSIPMNVWSAATVVSQTNIYMLLIMKQCHYFILTNSQCDCNQNKWLGRNVKIGNEMEGTWAVLHLQPFKQVSFFIGQAIN